MQSNTRKVDKIANSVDYLVASTRDKKVGWLWYEKIIQKERQYWEHRGKVAPIKDWRYKGFTGSQMGSIKVGSNHKTGYHLVWLSGYQANEHFSTVAPHASKVARLDLAVTVSYEIEHPRLIDDYYEQCKHLKKPLPSQWRNPLGGNTLYIGSMKSDQYGRIYNKDSEQHLDTTGKLVRYEVVFKNKHSTALRDAMVEHKANGKGPAISATVKDWFRTRGVACCFDSKLPKFEVRLQKSIQSVDRKLEWLQSGVKPTILSLLEQGYREELERVLGIEIGQILEQSALPL